MLGLAGWGQFSSIERGRFTLSKSLLPANPEEYRLIEWQPGLDSAILLFVDELRTTRDLLYQPRLLLEEAVLSSILANLAPALDVLAELLTCLPAAFNRS